MTPNQQYKDLDPDDVIQEGDARKYIDGSIWIPVSKEMIGKPVDHFPGLKFRRPVPVQEAAKSEIKIPQIGNDNYRKPIPIPVQEVEAGKEKCKHTFNQEERLSWLCSKCGMWEPDIELSRLEGENEELRNAAKRDFQAHEDLFNENVRLKTENEELRRRFEPEKAGWHCNFCGLRYHEPVDADLVKECIQCNQSVNSEGKRNIEQLYSDWRDKELTTLRTQLDKAVKALEPFAEIAKQLQPVLKDYYKNTMDWAVPTVRDFRHAQQTLADIKKG